MKGIIAFSLLASLSFSAFSYAEFSKRVTVGSSPDNNYDLLLKTINSAKQNLDINIYEITSNDIVDAIVSKIKSGIKVRILIEGQIVGGFKAKNRAAIKKLYDAIQLRRSSHSEIKIMKAAKIAQRRYRYNHAKYTIADDKLLEIGSENYANSGHPQDYHKGNRGWEIQVEDNKLVYDFSSRFEKDFLGIGAQDLVSMNDASFSQFLPKPDDTISNESSSAKNNYENPLPPKTLTDCELESIFSPESSKAGLIDMISDARKSIDIETMTFDYWWKANNGNPYESPLFAALREAAQKGVQIRVLMNDPNSFAAPAIPTKSILSFLLPETFFGAFRSPKEDDSEDNSPYKNSNYATVKKFMELKNQGLPVKAYISKNKAMGVNYIHNKGMTIDNNETLISSINWGWNSITNNRESAVRMKCASGTSYYKTLFERDWKATTSK